VATNMNLFIEYMRSCAGINFIHHINVLRETKLNLFIGNDIRKPKLILFIGKM
jgi:hypothetical protein